MRQIERFRKIAVGPVRESPSSSEGFLLPETSAGHSSERVRGHASLPHSKTPCSDRSESHARRTLPFQTLPCVLIHASVLLTLLCGVGWNSLASGQDIDAILQKADKLLEDAKTAYENARTQGSAAAFVDAGFKLEEARIKYFVLQEIGSPEQQRIAVDRLRAVNQLNKLIHDGKVAISGNPVDPPFPNPIPPAVPEPGSNPPPKSDRSSAAEASVGVNQRASVPDASQQKEAEKLVRDLFKEQYAKKAPADRRILAKSLLQQAVQTPEDTTALWVLYREAQDAAVQACDVGLIVSVIDLAARRFDIDPLSMKSSALSAAGKAAKAVEEFVALCQALDKLIEELMAEDLYDSAEKTAALFLQTARKANDPKLVGRASTRAKDIAEFRAKFQSMKTVLGTLARTPDDAGANLDMGQFLCFMKGNWDLGLRFLLKGSDPGLKSLAEREQAVPLKPADLIVLGDGWWDLAEKEKNALRKGQMIAHTKDLYEAALPNTSGLVKARLEKRLAESVKSEPARLSGVWGNLFELLPLIDLKKDVINGTWELSGGQLSSPAAQSFAKIQIPYLPPEEYDLTVVLEKAEGRGSLEIGVVSGTHQFTVGIDGWDGGDISGINVIDGKGSNENETTYRGKLLQQDKTSTIVCSIRKTGVSATVDGKLIFSWKGDLAHLTVTGGWQVPRKDALFLGTFTTRLVFQKLQIAPISGQGKKLR